MVTKISGQDYESADTNPKEIFTVTDSQHCPQNNHIGARYDLAQEEKICEIYTNGCSISESKAFLRRYPIFLLQSFHSSFERVLKIFKM
jgi:hypothetical protein